MRNYLDAEVMAKHVRSRMSERGLDLSRSECLELVAGQFGYESWERMAARIRVGERAFAEVGGVRLKSPAPIIRISDRSRAREFYLDYLGFVLDWLDDPLDESAGNGPLYTQISRGRTTLHLSEHRLDGTPGVAVYVPVAGLDALHAELAGKRSLSPDPGIEIMPPRLRTLSVIDPFGNQLRFGELSSVPFDESGRPMTS